MRSALHAELSTKCRRLVLAHWGRQGLREVREHPVSWVRHEANPHLKALRRKHRALPFIAVRGEVNRILLELSNEHPRGDTHGRN